MSSIKCNGDNSLSSSMSYYPETEDEEIVISGMAGKFPNCHNVDEFKENLFNKVDMIDDAELRWRHINPELPKRYGYIYDIEKFDAKYFGVHYKLSNLMDPQGRILIEVAYEAIIDAGINPKSLAGTKTGVFIGSCSSESERKFLSETNNESTGILGVSRAMMPNRISYSLGLNGPSLLLDTACSSSMYALDAAFSAFRCGQIDAAIVGGSNLLLDPSTTLLFARLGVLAMDGYCRPFDNKASGYTRSEAISCIFLQRKRDAKRVYGTLVYSQTNCDGYKPEGITYPSGKQQEKLITDFYNSINVTPNDLGYMEAHSTGTVVGDPEECRAINTAVCSQRDEPLLVGSVKSNIGHTEATSAVAAIVKACFILDSGKIPPNINFTELRSDIPSLAEGRMVVVTEVTDLKKPYIGINSFGFGGANGHALLKANKKSKVNNGLPNDDIPRLVTWAGRTEESVDVIVDAINKNPLDSEYIALLHNIQKTDSPGMVYRGYGIFAKNGESTKVLARDTKHFTEEKRPVVWVFSGMGSQWTSMGTALMTIPEFRQSIERCHNTLLPKGLDLIQILTATDSCTFDNILHSFVGIAAIQIALVDVLRLLNLEPDYIIGHSVGELGCGYADGGFTTEEMILASYYRGKVSLDTEKIKGSMAAIGIGYEKIMKFLPPTIEVACHNSADSCTISGPAEEVENFVSELQAKNIFAKEVPCSNIAYHSRYIAHMGPQLLKYLQETIPHPKLRSSKWLSSSVLQKEWENTGRNLCSAEYHTNNLLNSVYFEETFALLPKNSLTIEIAPHGLLQTILKRSMPDGVHIPLTQRGNKDNALFFLTALGKLFNNGVTLRIANLYPNVKFPVSRDTRGISSLIRWDHSENWFVMKNDHSKLNSTGECTYTIDLTGKDLKYLTGHVIDGKMLFPGIGYLQYVWETFVAMHYSSNYVEIPVEFKDVKFVRATNVSTNTKVDLKVMIFYGTGQFEVTEAGSLVVSGTISKISEPTLPKFYNFKEDSTIPLLPHKDFYKELKLRGYHYNDAFRAVNEARGDGLYGKVEWKNNWVTFIDAMLQIQILSVDSRSLLLPTKIGKMRVMGALHYSLLKNMEPVNPVFNVYIDNKFDRIVCGGVEIVGLQASQVQRRRAPGMPILEKYQFLPQSPFPVLTMKNAIRMCVQLALENCPVQNMKIIEVEMHGLTPIISNFIETIEEVPLITGDYFLLTDQNTEEIAGVHMENSKLTNQKNCYFIVIGELNGDSSMSTFQAAHMCLTKKGYLLVRTKNILNIKPPQNFKIIATIPIDQNGEILLMLQASSITAEITEPIVIEASEKDTDFKWLTEAQQAMINKSPIVLYSYNEKLNGIIGLVNCLRKEPDGHLITCFFINDKTAPEFNITHPFYNQQYTLGWTVNVNSEGKWGSYRHLPFDTKVNVQPTSAHIYANIMQKGDLSSFRWFEGPLDPANCSIRVVYSSINFKDVMLASGRLNLPASFYASKRIERGSELGFEYSGINLLTGRRVMIMAISGMSSYIKEPSQYIWDVPDHWSLKEAATVPVIYLTVYYAFFVCSDIRKGKSILIHAGTGGIGLAAIRVALAYGLEVYTTCSTPEKKQFLLKTFPQLEESHIGNSRNTSFENMIALETDGKGVDFVLNSLSEEMLFASISCLAKDGHFLEIGKYDMVNDSKLGMSCFLRSITFHPILADKLVEGSKDVERIRNLMDIDIKKGIIQPIPATVFPPHELGNAFRYLGGGKHIGKVIVQLRDDPESPLTLPVSFIKQTYFKPNLCYIVPGGLGGFGMELADWMVLRGARKLMLNSRHGITKSYQSYRISIWKTYGCETRVNTSDITTMDGCRTLLRESQELGPIGGVFNLAVVLRDGIFANQTKEKFIVAFAPKAMATKYLDELTRSLCPQLEHFVVFSSVSCGRGNAGQTNYGMANSIMERIIEDRVRNGYPGKAIQWGAVGEVGLVAEMAEDKIDMEIGGTLQQRISSCLQELDNLLSVPEPLVSSMVVAEKRNGTSGNQSVVDVVMKIMGIRDLKSISKGTTLSDMGMDSLTAVEIKQNLERDFDLCLTPQDLRSLTFQKLQQYADAKNSIDGDNIKITTGGSEIFGMELLFRNLGDEKLCKEIIVPIKSADADVDISPNPYIIIPGIEGTVSLCLDHLGNQLSAASSVLQLHSFADLTTVEDIAQASLEHIKSLLKKDQPFCLIGYSFGSVIAVHIAKLLEKSGYNGRIFLIDGSPHFLKKLALQLTGADLSDIKLYDMLLSTVLSQICPQITKEWALCMFAEFDTLPKKLTKFSEYVDEQTVYSRYYAEAMVMAVAKRIRMMAEYDLNTFDVLESPIMLVRPSEAALKDIAEDYNLSSMTSSQVLLKVIEGNHSTILENRELVELINEFAPTQ